MAKDPPTTRMMRMVLLMRLFLDGRGPSVSKYLIIKIIKIMIQLQTFLRPRKTTYEISVNLTSGLAASPASKVILTL